MAESINEKLHKIKFLRNDFLIFFIFVLALFIAFALGYLSHSSKTPIKLYSIALKDVKMTRLDFVIASKKGTKYYFLWCPGVDKIKKSNLIGFKNKEEAEKAGYSLSKTCK